MKRRGWPLQGAGRSAGEGARSLGEEVVKTGGEGGMGRAEGAGAPPALAVLLHAGPPEVTRGRMRSVGGQLPMSGLSGLITYFFLIRASRGPFRLKHKTQGPSHIHI